MFYHGKVLGLEKAAGIPFLTIKVVFNLYSLLGGAGATNLYRVAVSEVWYSKCCNNQIGCM